MYHRDITVSQAVSPPPRRFFVDSGTPRSEIWHDYSLLLWNSGHQVSLNDPTSHHLFGTLKQCQSQTRELSKLQDVISPQDPLTFISRIFFCILVAYVHVNFLTSSHSTYYKSMGENQVANFLQILVCNSKKKTIMTSIMTIPDYLDTSFAMWQTWGYATSSKVTTMFLPIALHR